MKTFYLLMMGIGTVVPWLFFGYFFATSGFEVVLFLTNLFGNGASGGFASDLLISILIFWVWSFFDSRKLGIERWWLVLPAGFCVGLSLALPLYLYLREERDR